LARIDQRIWIVAAMLASAAMLAAAHWFERIENLAPCALCLTQREVYWTVLGLGALGGAAAAAVRPPWGWTALTTLLGIVFLVGAGVAGYHVGVEATWWPGPAACSSAGPAGPVTADSIAAALATPQTVVRCDEIAWSLWGVSMAGYNMAISLVLAAASFAAGVGFGPFRRAIHG
jgi:disulfide bond formation protein DsbB